MRSPLFFTAIFLVLSCDSTREELEVEVQVDEPISKISEVIENQDCNYLFDTITDEDYKMHLHVLNKYYDESKRGYIFGRDGDTLNVFLYDQDIGALLAKLNPNEKGIYFSLTNKVVNLIVQEDPYVLGHGLFEGDKEKFNYFMSHVGLETCEPLDLEKMEAAIETKMKPYKDRGKKNQALLLEKIQSIKATH